MLSSARAQSYPSRPIALLIPYASGGPADLIARLVGAVISDRLGQAVIVQSKPGASGQIAGQTLLHAPGDGYTLLVADNSTLGIAKAVYRNYNYDPQVDVVPIAPLMLMPMVLYVPKTSPFNSLADLLAAAKSRALNFASQGNASIGHLLGEMLKADSGGQFIHIPYQGSALAMTSLLGNQVDLLFDGIGPGIQHLRAGRLKVIAVAGPSRLPQTPEVPTTSEAELPNVSMSLWLGVVAKTGTASALVQKLHDEFAYAMEQPTVLKVFTDLGFQPMSMTREKFRAFIKSEAEQATAIVRERHITVD